MPITLKMIDKMINSLYNCNMFHYDEYLLCAE